MSTVKISADQKILNENQIITRYEKITSIIDSKIKKAEAEQKPVDRYKKMNEDNLTILMYLVKIKCDFVRKKFGPQFKQNPSDLELATVDRSPGIALLFRVLDASDYPSEPRGTLLPPGSHLIYTARMIAYET